MKMVKNTETAIALLREVWHNNDYYIRGDLNEATVAAVKGFVDDPAGHREYIRNQNEQILKAIAELEMPALASPAMFVRQITRD